MRYAPTEEPVATSTVLGEDAETSLSSGVALDAGLRSDLIARAQRQRRSERLARSLYLPFEMLRELFSGLALVSGILFACALVGSVIGFISNTDALIRLWMDGILAVVAMFGLVALVGCIELLLWVLGVLLGKLARRNECEPTPCSSTNRVADWVIRVGRLSNL